MDGKKVLITGGAGFLGSNLVEALAADNNVIIADDLSRRGAAYNLKLLQAKFPNLKLVMVDIFDMPLTIAVEKPDVIYHFAAQVAVTTSVISPESDFRINAEGTFRIAATAHKLGIPLVFTSSNKVYGDNVNKIPLKELPTRWEFDGEYFEKGLSETFSVDANHHSPYGVSKLAGELYVREFGGVVNRCSCMYGPYQHGIIDQGWLSFFILKKLRGEQVTIFGDGKQVRDAISAHDVVQLLVKQAETLMTNPEKIRGEVYNVGGGHGNTISLLELCERLNITPVFSDWRPADQKVFYCDISKARDAFGWQPKIKLADGLDELVKWSEQAVATQ